jgi:multisubunit Na+/H+ antiporter MnhB subunit
VHGSGLVDLRDNTMAFPFAAGCALGITGWFLTLLWIIRRYREQFKLRTLNRVVRMIGAVLLLLSLWLGWRFVSYFLGPTSV